jgi:hypothetical protein
VASALCGEPGTIHEMLPIDESRGILAISRESSKVPPRSICRNRGTLGPDRVVNAEAGTFGDLGDMLLLAPRHPVASEGPTAGVSSTGPWQERRRVSPGRAHASLKGVSR